MFENKQNQKKWEIKYMNYNFELALINFAKFQVFREHKQNATKPLKDFGVHSNG